ncbi:hypothetical protein Tco_1302326 [Tanacetum coccineum]
MNSTNFTTIPSYYARDCPKPRVYDSKYFQEQMMLAKKYEAGIILDEEHNDFLLADASEVEELKDMEINNGRVEQDHHKRDAEIESLIKNVQIKAKKQRMIYEEVKQRNDLLTKELEKYKERVREFESKTNNKTYFQKEYSEATHLEKKLDQQIRTQFLQDKEEFTQMESELSETFKQNKLLNDRLLESTLTYDIVKCVMIHSKTRDDTENENIKLEYQKLFDSIKKTRSQTQKEINELIKNVNQKTYAYGDLRTQNQDLLTTISELKAMLKTAKKGKFVNTMFDKPSVLDKPICVIPINKKFIQKKRFVHKTEEKHVLTKPVTSQTSLNKKKDVIRNTNVIALGMYKLKANNNQETHAQANNNVSTSTGLRENVEVHLRKNKETNVTSHVNVFKTKDHVANVNAKNALKANVDVMCDKNVLTSCHDKCLARYKLLVNSKVRRSLFTTPNAAISKFLDTTQ